MGLETGTYVSDLVITNPASNDLEAQGYQHLQLIKKVLQNTFPNATTAFPIPVTLAKAANYTVVKADRNTIIQCDPTAGSFTLTLPSLVAGDAGWSVGFMKTTTTTNPFFVAPAAGTLNSGNVTGLAKARRSIPGVITHAFWDGAAWWLSRVSNNPVGSTINYFGTSLPVGYEWPNGQTLTSVATNYPEYAAIVSNVGATPDLRGRSEFGIDNMGGSAANRITAGHNFDGTVVGNAGGAEFQTLSIAQGNLPGITLNVTIGGGQGVHAHSITAEQYWVNVGGQAQGMSTPGNVNGGLISLSGTANAALPAMLGSAPLGGSGTSLTPSILPPAMVCLKLLLVE